MGETVTSAIGKYSKCRTCGELCYTDTEWPEWDCDTTCPRSAPGRIIYFPVSQITVEMERRIAEILGATYR